MRIYTHTHERASRPAADTPSAKHRATFAREAAIDAFGPRAVYTLDEPNVYSHRPNHGPRPLGQIAAKVADDTGIKAFRHWMAQAAKAESDDARGAAIEIATEIARLLGLQPVHTTGRPPCARRAPGRRRGVNLQHYQVGLRAIPRDSTA